MNGAPLLLSFILGTSLLLEMCPDPLIMQWVLLLFCIFTILSYKYILMIISFVHQQENTTALVIHHVKRIYSLSKHYYALNIDSTQQMKLIGLVDREEHNEREEPKEDIPNEEEEEEEESEEENDMYKYLLNKSNHPSGRHSPTPSLSTTTSTISISSIDNLSPRKSGRVGQLVYLFESGQLYRFQGIEKQPFINDRKFNFDPTINEWQKVQRSTKSKTI